MSTNGLELSYMATRGLTSVRATTPVGLLAIILRDHSPATRN